MNILKKIFNRPARTPRQPAAHTQQDTHTPHAYQSIASMAGTLRAVRENKLRLQGQWITVFLAGVVFVSMLAGLYLDVTARAAIAGREVQSLELQITANERINADLQTQIASLLSNQVMEQRARAMGFEELKIGEVQYLVIPGYFPETGIRFISPQPEGDLIAASPEFKQSLFEWVGEQMRAAATPLTDVQP